MLINDRPDICVALLELSLEQASLPENERYCVNVEPDKIPDHAFLKVMEHQDIDASELPLVRYALQEWVDSKRGIKHGRD